MRLSGFEVVPDAIEMLRVLSVLAICSNYTGAMLLIPLLWYARGDDTPFVWSAIFATSMAAFVSGCLVVVAFRSEEIEGGWAAQAGALAGTLGLAAIGADKTALALRLFHGAMVRKRDDPDA